MGTFARTELREIGWRGVEWINLADDKDPWRGLVKIIIKLLVS
jgi:hypothetical protein